MLKTRILLTIPKALLDEIDMTAGRKHLSRGEFIRQSVASRLERPRASPTGIGEANNPNQGA
jgi:metal-responsive CopG/Arc/MetJ family transcriptional regulator